MIELAFIHIPMECIRKPGEFPTQAIKKGLHHFLSETAPCKGFVNWDLPFVRKNARFAF